MTNDKTNQFTLVEDKGEMLVYEVPASEMNLIDHEQLEELKKSTVLFFDCENYIIRDASIQFFYKKEKDFKKIEYYRNKDKELMKTVALQLLQIESLIGTQYTTVIHPKNIFIKPDGTLKCAHRGIRNVFPNQTMHTAKIVTDIRKLFIYLFSDIPFELIEEDTYHLQLEDPLLIKFRKSKTLNELKSVVENYQSIQKNEAGAKKENKVKKQVENKPAKENPLHRLSPLTTLLIGLIIGMALIYFVQVIPTNNTSANEIAAAESKAENEINGIAEEKSELEQELDESETIIRAYRNANQEEIAEAVAILEGITNIEEAEEGFLFNLYVSQNTVESLSKGLELGEEYELAAIRALGSLDSDEAMETITIWETELDEVRIEQAYINMDYERVIELSQAMEGNNRAKLLAAYSYIEMEKPAEALKLGKELNNNRIQIDSLLKENQLLPENEDLDDDEKEARKNEIQEELERLRED